MPSIPIRLMPMPRCLAVLLICALLFAQWMGFAHRLDHAGLPGAPGVTDVHGHAGHAAAEHRHIVTTHGEADHGEADHGEAEQAPAEHATANAQHEEDAAGHSCAAYEAATLSAPFVPALPFLQHVADLYVRLAWTAFSCWDAPVIRHFSSRAPPVSLL